MWPKHGLKNRIFSVKIIRREMAASEHPWAHHIMNFTSAIRDTQNYIFSSRNISDSKEKTEVILKHLFCFYWKSAEPVSSGAPENIYFHRPDMSFIHYANFILQ